MMEKQLYLFKMVDGIGVPFPSLENQATLYSFDYDCKRMGNAPTISASFYYSSCLDNLWDNDVFVTFNGENYFIDMIPSSSYSNTDARYKHEVIFVSERRVLENIYFKDGILTEFHFFGDIAMFCDRINTFLNDTQVGYNVVLDSGVTSEDLDIDISKMFVNEALQYAFERYEIPYYFVGKTIHFGFYQSEIADVFEYGRKNALLSINKQNKNERVITAITGVGSSENIPYYYPNFNESGEHNVTTVPASLVDNINSINYAILDNLTNLREGGSALFYKKTINPINNDIDEIGIMNFDISPVTTTYEKEINWSKYVQLNQNGVQYEDIEQHIYITPSATETININLKIEAEKQDHNGELRECVVEYYSQPSDGYFDVWTTLSSDYYTILNDVITITMPIKLQQIRIRYKYRITYNIDWSGGQINFGFTQKYSYALNYRTNKRGLTANGRYHYNEDYYYKDETTITTDYMQLFSVILTRELAAFSDGYFIPKIMAKFRDIDEYTEFSYSSITIKDENDNSYSYWESDSGIVYFRNQDTRKTFTITITIPVTLRLSDYGLTQANEIHVYFDNFLGRTQTDYDYIKFNDNSTINYKRSGIKFTDLSLVNDLDKIIFSETVNWIEPKPNLMPSVYRDTLGNDIWYKATDDSYENIYDAINPKELIVENKDDIKPSIVGIKNASDYRIDIFSAVAFDLNDNNEWTVDESGENQELKHSFFFVKLRRFNGTYGFNLFNQALETGEMIISMTSGACGACNFTIMVNEDGLNTVQVDDNGNLLRDEDGNIMFGSPQDIQQDTSANEVWICLRKEEDSYGIVLPDTQNGIVPIAASDTFVLTNILLPNSYILNAEDRLENALIEDLRENNVDKFSFSIDFSRIYLAENQQVLTSLNENSKINVKYNQKTYPLFISSYSYSMSENESLPHIKVELVETLGSSVNSIQKQINQIKKEILYNKNTKNYVLSR